jgi:hypothetical protein
MEEPIITSEWFDVGYKKSKYKFKNIPKNTVIIVDYIKEIVPNIPNIFIQIEPEIICPQEKYLIENHHKYHQIITYNENVLKACPNAKRYFYGTKWLLPHFYLNNDIKRKKFQASHIGGTKKINNAPGHILRQILHHSQNKIAAPCPITFFRSGNQQPLIKDYGNNPIVGEHKNVLFEEYQYAFVIENSRAENYFTEKLIDCLLMKTIPVYYGAPNIGTIFNTAGWIILETGSIKEINEKLSQLTAETYNTHYSVISENYETALKYINLYQNIDNAA